jgi:hypothetical protein
MCSDKFHAVTSQLCWVSGKGDLQGSHNQTVAGLGRTLHALFSGVRMSVDQYPLNVVNKSFAVGLGQVL